MLVLSRLLQQQQHLQHKPRLLNSPHSSPHSCCSSENLLAAVAAPHRKSNRFISPAYLCVCVSLSLCLLSFHLALPTTSPDRTKSLSLSVFPFPKAAGRSPDTLSRNTSLDTQTWQPQTVQRTHSQGVSISKHVLSAWKSPQSAGESQTSSAEPSRFDAQRSSPVQLESLRPPVSCSLQP